MLVANPKGMKRLSFLRPQCARTSLLAFGLTLIAAFPCSAELQKSQRSGTNLDVSFEYLLSNFSGTVPSQWARLDFDSAQQEIYTLNQGSNEVRIFNRQGMEIFAFGADGEIVSAVDIASAEDGRLYVLARNFTQHAIQILNYRGEPEAVIRIQGLPESGADFAPDRIEERDGRLYLLDSSAARVVVIDQGGLILAEHDLSAELAEAAKELDPEKKKATVLDVSGFCVGPDGSLYFTTPALFSAFRLVPGGELEPFGIPGSGPGKFGVVSGIAADAQGNIYVADRLRSVVMIFDRNFSFLGEFGYRGDRPEDLIVPDDLALDPQGNRLFVAQAANKGVGVYRVILDETR